MKTKIIIAIFMLFLGSCSIVGAVSDPIDHITINYRDFEYTMFDSNQSVDLVYINSEMPQNALNVQYIEFYPSTNETKYKLTSNDITANPWFTPGVSSFYYQDLNSGQVYKLNVDYSGIEIPLSDTQINLMNLQENYTNLLFEYNNLTSIYENLTNDFEVINTTLSNYTNMTNQSMTDVTKQLVHDYNNVTIELNKAFEEINTIAGQLNETTNMFDELTLNYEDLQSNYNNLNDSYNILNETYNTTYNGLLEMGKNFSEYKLFVEQLTSYDSSGVYFQGAYYYPFAYYNNEIERLETDLAIQPAFIILSVIVTIIVCVLIAKKYIKSSQLPYEEEIDITEKEQKFNNFFIDKLKDVFTLRQRKKPEKSTINTTYYKDIKPNSFERQLNEYQTKTDKKIEHIETKIDANFQDIKTSIDKVLEKNGTPMGDIEK